MVKRIKYGDGNILYRNENGELHRDDGPAVISPHGGKIWYRNGKKHREDGPALIANNLAEIWYRNGVKHRDDGPAAIYQNGIEFWYKNGKRIFSEKHKRNISKAMKKKNGPVD